MTEHQNEPKLNIEYTTPSFQLHSFGVEIENNQILFQVVKMKDSLYLWVGNKHHPVLQNMALAMNTKYDNFPIATKILGDEMETQSKNVACRLSKKLNKPVYVSYNLEETTFTVPVIEKRLSEEIKKFPEKF